MIKNSLNLRLGAALLNFIYHWYVFVRILPERPVRSTLGCVVVVLGVGMS